MTFKFTEKRKSYGKTQWAYYYEKNGTPVMLGQLFTFSSGYFFRLSTHRGSPEYHYLDGPYSTRGKATWEMYLLHKRKEEEDELNKERRSSDATAPTDGADESQ